MEKAKDKLVKRLKETGAIQDMLRHYLINEIKRIRELRNKLKEEYPELMK